MKTYARLHVYPHQEPQGRAYIVADAQALRALADLCRTASHSMTGMETATFFGSDGHEYELAVVSDTTESEWPQLRLPGLDIQAPKKLLVVQNFDELVKQSQKEKNSCQHSVVN